MKNLSVLSLLVALSLLGACEFAGNAVAPSIAGGGATSTQAITIVPLDVTKLGTPSGTSAGARIGQYRSNLAQLQQSAVQQVQRGKQLQANMEANVASYQIAVGALNQQGGAAPESAAGTWRNAQAQLQSISTTLDQMSGLSDQVAKNVAYAAFLLQSIREANTAGDATAQDHTQLGILEDSTSQTSGALDRLLDAMRQDVLRRSHFLGEEGAKLARLAPPSAGAAPVVAPSTAGTLPQQPAAQSNYVAGPAGAGLATGRPFVVIRFDNPGVEYEQQLYQAVSAALARSPDVAFDLVGVSPASGSAEDAEAARASMEKVRASLQNMGLSPDRVSISQLMDPDIQTNEVRLYVR